MSAGIVCALTALASALSALPNVLAGLRRLTALYCVTIALFITLCCLRAILSYFEIASASLFELCSKLLAARPCGIHQPQDSAIVIVGGEADLGRRIALRCSELGYTVFALCRTQAEETRSDTPGKASNVSSVRNYPAIQSPAHAYVEQLLYEWHNKRKRSQRSFSWGLIAPIVLEIGSEAQRAHAFETVHAYCAAHSLHLVAAIISPSASPAPSLGAHAHQTRAVPDTNYPQHGQTLMELLNWGDVAQRSLTEQILVAQSCVDMLSSSSGRIILVSRCHSPSQIEGAFSSVARCFEDALESLGIRLSSVLVGPSASTVGGSHDVDESTRPITANLGLFKAISRCNTLRQVFEDVVQYFPVRDQDVTHAVQRIMMSPYPKCYHIIGVSSCLHVFMSGVPDVMRLFVKSCGQYAF